MLNPKTLISSYFRIPDRLDIIMDQPDCISTSTATIQNLGCERPAGPLLCV